MLGHEDTIAAIAERTRLFTEAYRAADPVLLVASYFVEDEDGPVAYPPGGIPPVKGREALIAMFSEQMRDVSDIRLETLEVTASGGVASEVGRAHLTLAEGASATGRYVVCWIATAKGWRAKSDFFAIDGWLD